MHDLLLELNAKLINEKVKISPIGKAVGLDGRVFKIDGLKLIENIQKNGLDIALNLNHQGGEAYGWFDKNSLELRQDGIYASLELTPKGKELVESKAFRYLSPEYYVDNDKNVIHLDAMGLVNQPNLLNRALNKAKSLINSTKNSKSSTPRSGTGALAFGSLGGLGSPLKEHQKERNAMNEEELQDLQKLAEEAEVKAENLEDTATQAEEKATQGENPNTELEDLRKENEELKAKLAELSAKLEASLNKNEEVEAEFNKKRLDSLLQNGLILPNRYQKALNMKGKILEDYLDVCKKEAGIILGKKEMNFTSKRKELNAYEAKVFKQLGIKGDK